MLGYSFAHFRDLLFYYKEGTLMQTPRQQRKYLTTPITPRSSQLPSPTFARTQRRTREKSFDNLRAQIKDQLQAVASRSPNKNYITKKSQIFLRIDNKLQAQIKRKITLQKLQSKMSIISMQSTKFKISRNKSMAAKSVQNNKTSIPKMPEFIQSPSNKLQRTQSRRQLNRYPLNTQLEAFRSYLRIIALNHQKNRNERKSEILSRVLVEYFITADEREVRKDLHEIKGISAELVNCLAKPNHSIDLNILKLIDRDISKLIFNMCYQLYRKKQKGVKHSQLVNINKQIQYTTRRLKFYDLTLKTCFDLGKLYCDQMQYQKAFQEYTNAVKLAIFIDNKYYQEIAIDKLGICKYYLGDSVSALYFHNNIHHLSGYDLNRVKAEYSNQTEIKRLIEEKRGEFKKVKQNKPKPKVSKISRVSRLSKDHLSQLNKENLPMSQSFDEKVDVGEFTFLKDNRNQFYPLQNNHDLKINLKKIIKIPTLKDKIHILKKNLTKNDMIGFKKYCGQNYIVPTASLLCRKQNSVERNEVCLSHRSYNRNEVDQEMADIDNDCKIIMTTLNYFINENIINKEVVRELTEQSTKSDQSQFFE